MTKHKSENGDRISRDKLIVPEEIFAAEDAGGEPTADSSDAYATDGGEPPIPHGSTANIADSSDEPHQISFFGDADEATTSKEQSESRIYEFEKCDEQGYDPKAPRIVDKIFDFIELFIFTVAAVFILTTLVFRHAIVDGESMEGTLYNGEHLIISNMFYEPERGDIIVFEDFSLDENLRKPIIKRVIAKGGDRVYIDYSGTVFVNGEEIDDGGKYLSGGRYIFRPSYEYACLEEYVVPDGCIFVLGDNRNNSTDSRCFGAISEDTVLGEVKIRISPLKKLGTVK